MRSDAPSWSLRDVNHRPPGAPRDTVSEASLEIDQGALTALIGPNGAGKTTLLRMLLGTIAPSSGTILFRGRAIREWSRRDLARSIGVVPQSEGEPLFGVRELVAMGRYPHLGPWQRERDEDVRAVDRAMTRCDVAQFADRWTTTLSGGEQQRVRLARALAQEPAILVLDEPTASLDIRHEMTTFELLRRLRIDGTTVLLATHNLNLAARYADTLVLMSRGRILAYGPAAEVLTPTRVATAYEWPVDVSPHSSGAPQVSPRSLESIA
ncbi:MAG TPA: ABC transporter ATP-binding protein [Gemmatimonadaceae bacterium]|nr:ABC transporter ATP-binding protein [Gemmatimonadaceae bacterium]